MNDLEKLVVGLAIIASILYIGWNFDTFRDSPQCLIGRCEEMK